MAYGTLATVCGWTWNEIDAFTLPRFYRLCRYWRKNPPTDRILAAVHGIEEKKPEKMGDLSELAAMFGQGPIKA